MFFMFGQLSGYGEQGHAGHAPPLSTLHWNQRWICWRCGCTKGPGQKIILPIITKVNLNNLQWSLKLLNAIFSMSLDTHSSELPVTAFTAVFHPITKTCKKWDMTLSSSMAMCSAMRDIHDAIRVPTKKSCSLLIGHMQIFKLIDFRTMGRWIWITFCFTHCIKLDGVMDFTCFGDFTALWWKCSKVRERTAVAGWSPVGVTAVLVTSQGRKRVPISYIP